MLGKFWDSKTASILCTTLTFAAVVAFMYGARETLSLFLFAILFAYFVEPLIAKLQRPLHGRIKAIAGVYVTLIGALIGVGLLVGPKIADEGKSLAQTIPALFSRLGSGQLIAQVGHSHGWTYARQAQLQGLFFAHREDLLNYTKIVGAKLAAPASHVWWLILIPILSLFFLKDGQQLAAATVDLGRVPQERSALAGIISDVDRMLGSYIRSQVILSGLTILAYSLVLAGMRVPYALILGPMAGIFEFVPVVGPAIAAVAILGIAILSGYPHLLWLFLFLGTWRLIQDYVNAPRIMSQSLEISPLVQIFGVLAGGEIGGVIGALISVPIIAILRILWRRMSKSQAADIPTVTTEPVDGSAA